MRIRLLYFFCLSLFFWGAAATPVYAATSAAEGSPQISSANHQLSIENARNSLLSNKLAALQQQASAKVATVTTTLLQQANLTVTLAKTDLESTKLALIGVEDALNNNQLEINALNNQLHNQEPNANINVADASDLAAQLATQGALRQILEQRIKVLEKTQSLSLQVLQTSTQWQAQLQDHYHQLQQQRRLQALDQLAFKLQEEQKNWLLRLAELNKQLQSSGSYGLLNSTTYTNLEISILEAEERSNLIQLQLEIAKIRNNLDNFGISDHQQYALSSLNSFKRQSDGVANQLITIKQILQEKINLFQKRSQIIKQGLKEGIVKGDDGDANLAILSSLQNSYQRQLDFTDSLIQNTQKVQSTITHQLNQQIASRQVLPGFDATAWLKLGQELLEVPALALQALQNLHKSLLLTLYKASPLQILGWLIYFSTLILGFYWLRRSLIIGTERFEKRKQSVLTSNLFLVSLRLLKRFLSGAILLGVLISAPMLFGIPSQSLSLITGVASVIFSFSLILGFARIILLENTQDKSGHDVQLYHRLKWALQLGGLITTVTLMAHQLPVTFSVQDLLDRCFMLFLLVVALVLLRAWKIVPSLLQPYLEDKRPYLKQVVRLLSLLIPLTLLSNALVGLVGYVVLAWSIAAYQGLFLVVLTGYLIMRGILGELMNFIAAKLIRHLRNGWLWSEALLKPLHQILKIVAFIAAVAILCKLYGWGAQSWPVLKLNEAAHFPLFYFAGSVITPISLLELFFLIALLVWAARWTREFSYRWLFARTKDLGLRNSLAIFSQYIVVIIGILVALQVIGINLTALTVVASAFAFGIGLGLRDLANNFMTGVLLLIERPVHVGDYVTMANIDGEVAHIGMRAITVITDDRQELLVPNAIAFSQAFVNWTHRDSIVRVAITIRTARVDDPHRVSAIILEVLQSIPKVLTSPPPNVYLRELAEMLLKFEFEYYVDLRAIPSRGAVRSQILLALWDRFKAEGIHAPHYPHEVMLIDHEAKHE